MARIQAPLAAPPRRSLVSSLPRQTVEDSHWPAVDAVRFLPENCEGGAVFDPCAPGSKSPSIDDNLGAISVNPIGVWAGAICSTLDPEYAIRELPARARRLLLSCESAHVAREFSEGTLSQASANIDNFYLRQPGVTVVTGSGGAAPHEALACLEAALTECACSGNGIIHATRQIATYWDHDQLLHPEGDRLFTVNGTLVVVDAGYTGLSPDGVADASGVAWAYATGLMNVMYSEIIPVGRTPIETVNRETNVAAWIVERAFALILDDCCHVAAGVQVEPCTGLVFGS